MDVYKGFRWEGGRHGLREMRRTWSLRRAVILAVGRGTSRTRQETCWWWVKACVLRGVGAGAAARDDWDEVISVLVVNGLGEASWGHAGALRGPRQGFVCVIVSGRCRRGVGAARRRAGRAGGNFR